MIRRYFGHPAKFDCQVAATFPAAGGSKFGNRRSAAAQYAAVAPVTIAGRRGMFAAFLADADCPALLRIGVAEATEGELDFCHNCLHIAKLGADAPLPSNASGPYVLNATFPRDGLKVGPETLRPLA